jgi:hypothetical protein
MRPVSVEQPDFDQSRYFMMLDDAEMALQMNELADIPAAVPAKRPVMATPKGVPAPPMQYNDYLVELSSAACMIMDREECEALALEMLKRHELVAA